jgi:hypothetical protein
MRLSYRSVRPFLVTAAALAAAACADSTSLTSPSSPAASASKSPELNPSRHLYRTKDFYVNDKARYARPSSGTGISYHGGTVLQNGTKVVAIYWGSSTYPVGYQNLPTGTGTGTGDNSLIGIFLRNFSSLVNTSSKKYFNINHTYYGQTGAYITPTVTYTGYWNTASTSGAPAPSSSPTDADMIALVNWGIANGKISYDASTVYAIFTGTGVNLGGGFGSQYCAYHTHGSNSAGTFYYAAMPYNQQYVSGCTSGYTSPNGDVAANSEVNTLAHEIEETTTDDMGTAWYDNRGYENADKCAWTWGATASANGGTYNMSGGGYYFLVQQNWVNAGSGGCATGY